MRKTSVLFTSPPQLGKTTLLSLAELLLSKTKLAPVGLEFIPENKNSWYVVRVDFGSANHDGNASAEDWKIPHHNRIGSKEILHNAQRVRDSL